MSRGARVSRPTRKVSIRRIQTLRITGHDQCTGSRSARWVVSRSVGNGRRGVTHQRRRDDFRVRAVQARARRGGDQWAIARKIADETEARRCLRASRFAGVSAGEWALARAIGGRSLNVWRRSLAGRGAPRTTGAPRRSRPTPPQPAAHALLELVPAAASAKGRGRRSLRARSRRLAPGICIARRLRIGQRNARLPMVAIDPDGGMRGEPVR